MTVSTLALKNFRCYEHYQIEADPNLNLIIGSNASGKTSLLEALYVISHGKSFRTHRIEPLIHTGASYYQIVCHYDDAHNNPHVIGIRRNKQELIAKHDGKLIKTQAELAQQIPTQIIDPNVASLITKGPSIRRSYLDFVLFHVKPQYWQVWKDFTKLIQQRNSALRKKVATKVLSSFDQGFIVQAERLSELRESVFNNDLKPILEKYIRYFLPTLNAELIYSKGWSTPSLQEALDKSKTRDQQYQNTHYGPHKADINIQQKKTPIIHQISSGQQKLFAIAMMLAQVDIINQKTKKGCMLLMDDIGSELDATNQSKVIEKAHATSAQLWLTSLTNMNLVEKNANIIKVD